EADQIRKVPVVAVGSSSPLVGCAACRRTFRHASADARPPSAVFLGEFEAKARPICAGRVCCTRALPESMASPQADRKALARVPDRYLARIACQNSDETKEDQGTCAQDDSSQTLPDGRGKKQRDCVQR